MHLDLPPFRPHPLVRGGHLQTIVGSYLPSGAARRGVAHRVDLPDGDAIVLHDDRPTAAEGASGGWHPGGPVALLVHGLGGTHESGYMVRVSGKLRPRGVRVFRMDLRGCGAGLALARLPLHAGRSEDVAAAVERVRALCPGSPVHLVGFSMGANMALKLAGEWGACAPPEIASVLAICPPVDLAACSRNMQRGGRRIYDRMFVRSLLAHVRRRKAVLPSALSRPLTPPPQRVYDFDRLFTAPLSGFASVEEYYALASSGPWLPRVAVPTLVVAAASDPIVPVRSLETASLAAGTRLVIAPCGGHLGFVAARGTDADIRWLDWRIVEWIVAHSSRPAATMSAAAQATTHP